MRPVIIESPYAGNIMRNTIYLRRCLKDSIDRGEAPFASHFIYPLVLNELIPEERQKGIEAGYAWWQGATGVMFYLDYGWSPGMVKAKERFHSHSVYEQLYDYEERYIGVNPAWSV